MDGEYNFTPVTDCVRYSFFVIAGTVTNHLNK